MNSVVTNEGQQAMEAACRVAKNAERCVDVRRLTRRIDEEGIVRQQTNAVDLRGVVFRGPPDECIVVRTAFIDAIDYTMRALIEQGLDLCDVRPSQIPDSWKA